MRRKNSVPRKTVAVAKELADIEGTLSQHLPDQLLESVMLKIRTLVGSASETNCHQCQNLSPGLSASTVDPVVSLPALVRMNGSPHLINN